MNSMVLGTLIEGTWREWVRDRLARAAFVLLAMLLCVTAVAQLVDGQRAAAHRAEHQQEADAAFAAQPDRHPHRMVHYGHYVFRTPAPLAVLDPGVDSWTGRSMFLEGHRRNTATFAEAREGGMPGRFGAFSPVFVLQALVPLLLVVVGSGLIAGERARGTGLMLLAQGVAPRALLFGKALALALLAAIALLPMLLVGLWLVVTGAESAGPVALLVAGHGLYLLVWSFVVVAVSALTASPRSALAVLLTLWTVAVVVVPSFASEAAATAVEVPPRSQVDIEVAQALRSVGDSHDAQDPAFAAFRARVLAEYGVEAIEELPVNWRGLVAERGEADGAVVMNEFAERRLDREQRQAAVQRAFSWVSPMLAVRRLSMAAAGTDLEQHHRFLAAAEAHRFDFVQRLNRLHAEELSYAVDSARSDDEEASRRSRISAENWAQMPEFRFEVAPAGERVGAALGAGLVLLFWVAGAFALLLAASRRLERA